MSLSHRFSYTDDQGQFVDPLWEKEFRLAWAIQTELLNVRTHKVQVGEVSGISIPARMVGGDYFDFYKGKNNKLRIVIGDVMGKGIPAAMVMILTRGAFRSAALQTESPAQTLTLMNQALFEDLRKLKSFVTLFCADWDPHSRIFTYASAGHDYPFWVNKDQKAVQLPSLKDIMIGGLPNQVFKEKQIILHEKDMLFLYTDGIIEAVNKEGEQFRRERLIQVLSSCAHQSNLEIEKKVIESIDVFTEGVQQKDDITMVIIKAG